MDNEIKEDDLIFGDAMLLPNEDENWKFILADRTYTLDAPTEVIISRMLNQLLAEQAKNKKMVEALELIMNNDDEPSFENYTATQALLANEVNNAK